MSKAKNKIRLSVCVFFKWDYQRSVPYLGIREEEEVEVRGIELLMEQARVNDPK